MDDVLHRVSFEFTPEDLADVTVRHSSGTALRRRLWHQATLNVGAVAGIGAMLAMVLVTGLRDAASLAGLAVTAALVGVVVAGVEASRFETKFRRRILRVIAAEPSTSRVMRCDVELRRDGLRLQQQNFEMFYRWSDAISIEDVDAGIELRFRAGFVMVRARAFATPEERAAFLTLARAQSSPS